ncbi:hypothetical protein ACWKWU_02380 [Chitinophaga lutea]
MKRTLSLLTMLGCLTFIACQKQKSGSPTLPPATEGTKEIRFRLGGELLVTESPLSNGRVAPGTNDLSKTVRDSTLYVVMVKTQQSGSYYTNYMSGLYDVADSIRLNIPATGNVRVVVNAYRRGTSIGLYHTWENGLRKFDYPFNSVVNNKSDSLHRNYPNVTEDTISWVRVFNPIDTLQPLPGASYPEVDAYRGSIEFAAATAPPVMLLNMRRAAFGLRFASSNFTSGKLIAEYKMPGDAFANIHLHTVTPADINSRFFIHSADVLKELDSLPSGQYVHIKWEKTDGSVVPIGTTYIRFKRNVMTTINITIPDGGRIGITPQITETTWSGTETVNL